MNNYLVDSNIWLGVDDIEQFIETFEIGRLYVPYVVLDEIDNLKTREGDKGFKARRAIRHIEKYNEFIHIIPDFTNGNEKKNDDIIISTAINNNMILITNDIGMKHKAIARGLEVQEFNEHVSIDMGVDINEPNGQKYFVNDFGIGFKNKEFTRNFSSGDKTPFKPQQFKSIGIGTISALDSYQACAMDSLVRDDITVLSGHAGSGKTLLSLAYSFQQIETQKRRKLVIFTNPTKARGSEELGFYTGDKDNKLLQNSIGGILACKLGGMLKLEALMMEGIIEIHPMSDIRGMEVSSNDIMYITEAQNVSKDLMKLAVQRCQEGCKIIIEGDFTTQVDSYMCEGMNNGMTALIKALKDYDKFAHVNLPIIRRSRIAELVDNM